MGNARFVAYATTKGKMFSSGGFPMVVADDDERSIIHGEIYDVDDDTLRHLDRLEGHPDWYCRHEVPTSYSPAWIYLMPAEAIRPQQAHVESGDWREYLRRKSQRFGS